VAAGVDASDPAVTGYVPLFHDLLRGELACRPSHRPGCRKLALDNLALLAQRLWHRLLTGSIIRS